MPELRLPAPKGCGLPKPAAAAAKALGPRTLRAEAARPAALLLRGCAEGWRRAVRTLGRRQRKHSLATKLRRPRGPATKALTEGRRRLAEPLWRLAEGWRRLAGGAWPLAECWRLAESTKALGGAATAALLRASRRWRALQWVCRSCSGSCAAGMGARGAGAATCTKVAKGVGCVPLRRHAAIPAAGVARLLLLLRTAHAKLRRAAPKLRLATPKLRRASTKLRWAAPELWLATELRRAAPKLRLAAELRWAAPKLRALARLLALRRRWRPIEQVSQQVLWAGPRLRRRRCLGCCSGRRRRSGAPKGRRRHSDSPHDCGAVGSSRRGPWAAAAAAKGIRVVVEVQQADARLLRSRTGSQKWSGGVICLRAASLRWCQHKLS